MAAHYILTSLVPWIDGMTISSQSTFTDIEDAYDRVRDMTTKQAARTVVSLVDQDTAEVHYAEMALDWSTRVSRNWDSITAPV